MSNNEIKLTPRESWLFHNIKGKYIVNIGFIGKGIRGKYLHNCFKKKNKDSFLVALDINIEELLKLQVENSLAGDINHLPFKDGVFDSIVLGEIIEHFYGIYEIFKEVKRITKKNGKIFITTPNSYGIFRFLRYWLLTSSKNRFSIKNINNYHGDSDHKNFWEPLSLCKLLLHLGFDVIELSSTHLKIPYTKYELSLKFWPFTVLSDNICILAEKK